MVDDQITNTGESKSETEDVLVTIVPSTPIVSPPVAIIPQAVVLRIHRNKLGTIALVKVLQFDFDKIVIQREASEDILEPHTPHKLPHKLRTVFPGELGHSQVVFPLVLRTLAG